MRAGPLYLLPVQIHITFPAYFCRVFGSRLYLWYAGAVERYDYDYSDEELQDLGRRWTVLADAAERIFVFFNNCRHGQAAKNARRFAEIAQAG